MLMRPSGRATRRSKQINSAPGDRYAQQRGKLRRPAGPAVSEDVRGLYITTRQYSSLCVSAVVLTIGGDDIEDGVPDREQADCERGKQGRSGRETGKRQTRRDNKRTLKHVTSWMACGWSEMRTETP